MKFRAVRLTQLPYSIKHWREKAMADLAVDSQSAKVSSTNIFFHHDFVQAVATYCKIKWALIKALRV